MIKVLGRHRNAILGGTLALFVVVLANVAMPRVWRDMLRENAFDIVLATDRRLRANDGAKPDVAVVVVDIDRRSLATLGPWPWPRETMARVIEAVAATKPLVIAVDVLFAGQDTRSPAALARQLGALIAKPEIATLADTLPDGDRSMSSALAAVPSILGFVLDSEQQGSVPPVPVLTRGPVRLDQVWRLPGIAGPPEILVRSAAGIGALALPGEADSAVRRVPLFVSDGKRLYPGLAAETVRVARGSSAYLLVADPQKLTIGDLQIALSRDGFLRLVPGDQKRRESRTISVTDVIDGSFETKRLAGAIALIGGSAPELGGLRATVGDPLTASVQIHADAIDQLLARWSPQPVGYEIEFFLIVVCGIAALLFAVGFAPLYSTGLFIAMLVLEVGSSLALSIRADLLLDPLTPAVGASIVFVTTSILSYSSMRQLQARIRRSFEQHLAPAVVRRIVEEPDLLKLRGERREVTALFTDIEDFTAITHRAGPEQLVAVLDDYIEGIAAIITVHGGMVDKIVGDAAHALFNAPVDLPDHPRRAVECAIAIREWSQKFQTSTAAASIGFGRTRIGVETGDAIVGDIGIGTKLDYTAHGDAINMAARLEAANKEIGSSICVGPVAASRCDAALFRPLGIITVRGRSESLLVFEPWPSEIPRASRESYLAAYQARQSAPGRAAELFEQVATEGGNDPVAHLMAKRLLATIGSQQYRSEGT